MNAANGTPKSLSEALERAGKSRIRIAEKCGVTDAAVGHWICGRFRPSGPSRILLAQELNVNVDTVDSWFEEQPQAVAS